MRRRPDGSRRRGTCKGETLRPETVNRVRNREIAGRDGHFVARFGTLREAVPSGHGMIRLSARGVVFVMGFASVAYCRRLMRVVVHAD